MDGAGGDVVAARLDAAFLLVFVGIVAHGKAIALVAGLVTATERTELGFLAALVDHAIVGGRDVTPAERTEIWLAAALAKSAGVRRWHGIECQRVVRNSLSIDLLSRGCVCAASWTSQFCADCRVKVGKWL